MMQKHAQSSDLSGQVLPLPAPVPVPPLTPVRPAGGQGTTTSWTATTGGNFLTAANWSNGVPASGVDATIDTVATNQFNVTLTSASATADSLSTSYAGLVISAATLTLQGVAQGSNLSSGTATALSETGGLVDFQNGPSENNTSSISGAGAAVVQNSGIIEVDAGILQVNGNSIFDGTLTGLGDKPDSGTVQLLGNATYTFGTAAVISVGQLELEYSGAGAPQMDVSGSLSYTGGFTQTGETTLKLGGTFTLDDTATASDVLGGTISGGTLNNAASAILNGADLLSNTTLANTGTLLLNSGGGTALTMTTNGASAPLLDNAAGHAIDVLNGSYTIAGGSITNAGTITLGTNADLTVTGILTSGGAIATAAGDILTVENGFIDDNAISGAGTLQILGGVTDSLGPSSTVSLGEVVLNNSSTTLDINTTSVTSGEVQSVAGTLDLGVKLSYAGTFDAAPVNSAVLLELGASSLTLTGHSIFNNAGSIEVAGTGSLVVSGTTTVEGNALYLADGASFSNAGSLTETGNFQIGDSIGPASAGNAAKGVWDMLGGTLGSGGSSLVSTFVNAGLFENTGSSGPAVVDSAFTSSGTISVLAGLETDFYGGLANTGAITGGGTIGLRGSGASTLSSGSTVSVGQINLLDNATLNVAANLSFAGTFIDEGGNQTLLYLGGHTLTLTGTSEFGDNSYGGSLAAVTGGGELANGGTLTVTNVLNLGLYLGGTTSLLNSGKVIEYGQVQIGDSSGDPTSITNSGTWNIVTGSGLSTGSNGSSSFTNTGLFTNTGSATSQGIYAVFGNTGTVNVNAGDTTYFYNQSSMGGTLAGAGAIVDEGTMTLVSGAVLSVSQFDIYGNSELSLGESISYGGSFNEEGSSNDTLNLGGYTLTVTGASSFGDNSYGGALAGIIGGALVNSGTLTITNAQNLGIDIGGTATLLNSGTVVQYGQTQIGDSSGEATSITNNGTWKIGTGSGLSTGSNGSSSFTNTGLFAITIAGSSQNIYAAFDNSGTVSVDAGDSLNFYDSSSLGGTLAGAGAIADWGTMTLLSGAVVTVSQLDIYGNDLLNLNENLSYAGNFNEEGGSSATLNLAGHTLTLTGASSFGDNNYGGNLAGITGGGRLANSGTLTITNTQNLGVYLAGTTSLLNSGTVVQEGQTQIGDGSGNVASITNNGTWNISTGSGIGIGTNVGSSFTNTALFENTSSGGDQAIYAVFTNTGTVSVAAGDATYFYNTTSLANKVSGAGTIAARGSGAITLQSGAVVSVGQLGVYDSATLTISAGATVTASQIDISSNGTLDIGENLSFAGGFTEEGSTSPTLNLGGHTLTLSGASTFGDNSYDGNLAAITGGGELANSGTLTITNVQNLGLYLGGTTTLLNSGTVIQNGQTQIGDNGGAATSISNSGTWDFATGSGISTGTNSSSSFNNSGLLKNAGSAAIYVSAVIDNTGTIDAVGTESAINFSNGGTLGGTLSGAGTLAFTGGLFSIAGTTAISAATIGIFNSGTDVTLGASDSYAGTFTEGGGSTLTLAGASTGLTLTGQDSFAGLVTGAGTLAVAAGSAVTADGMTIGGSAILQDGGVMGVASGLTIGNNSVSSASLTVIAGATFEITGNATLIANGTGGISNAGTFKMLGANATGTANIDALFSNTGTVLSDSGQLSFGAAVTNTGTIGAINGDGLSFATSVSGSGSATGVIDLTGGAFATFNGFVGSAETLSFTDTSSSVANLGAASNFDGTISGFGGENELHLYDFERASDSFANNVLSVTGTNTSGTLVTASLHFSAGYTLSDFIVQGDGGSGTTITFK